MKVYQCSWVVLALHVLIGCADSYGNTNIEEPATTPGQLNTRPKSTDSHKDINIEAHLEATDEELDLRLQDDSDDVVLGSGNGSKDVIGKEVNEWIEEFKECMSVRGYHIQNFAIDIVDSMNDATFRHSVDLCGVETDVLSMNQELLRWYGELVANMTPSQIQVENTRSMLVAQCIEERGWKVQLVAEDNGLLVLDQQYIDRHYKELNPKLFAILISDVHKCTSKMAEQN